MKHLALFFATISAICAGAYAQSIIEGVQARIYIVRGPIASFAENWAKPESPAVSELTEAKLGDDLHAVVFFSGQSLDKNSNAKVTYTINVTSPEGKSIASLKDLVGIDGKMPKEAAAQLYLGNAKMAARLPTNNPLFPPGKYKFAAIVTDHIGVRESRTETTIELK